MEIVNNPNTASGLKELLGMKNNPVGISFLHSKPLGINKWEGQALPSGCSFWKVAMSGNIFYTEPADHYNCAVGCHTHKISLPAERQQELTDTVNFMVTNQYLNPAEIPVIPTLKEEPNYVMYGSLDLFDTGPDLILLALNPQQSMLVYEAGLKAGVSNHLVEVFGRPGCAVLPLTQNTGFLSMSFGCKGSRIFTGIDDSMIYLCIPGNKWNNLYENLVTSVEANRKMEEYYKMKLN